MSGRSRRSPARLLAPLAIIAFAIAFLIVLSNSSTNKGSSGSSNASTTSGTTTRTGSSTTRSTSKFARRRTYTVRAGDTLGAIAIKTGVSVTNLEDLNPGLDPEGLVAGQKLKLRE
jgi:LysM repeat protein